MKVGDLVEIQLDRLARGGKAVGRAPDGRVVFVAGGAPDETARVRITKVSGRYIEGRAEELLAASPFRRSPPCPVVEKCGGCPWQHIVYDQQIAQKTLILRETLRRGHAFADSAPVERPFVASSAEWRYRSRITVHSRGASVGFMRRESHEFIAIEDCLIAHEGLVAFAARNRPPGTSRFQVTDSPKGPRVGGAFTQVHLEQNRALQTRVSEVVVKHLERLLAGRVQMVQILDLYCGNGNLSLPLFLEIRKAWPDLPLEGRGIELATESIEEATRLNRYPELRFEKADVARWLKRNGTQVADHRAEVVVLDPPRVGCDQSVMEHLAKRRPSQIVYVSCDPATLARDVARFRAACDSENVSYQVSEYGGFDLFPQTDHIEAVLVLERKGI